MKFIFYLSVLNTDLSDFTANNLDTAVNVYSYSSSSPYTCSSDGYVELKVAGTSNFVRIGIRSADNTNTIYISCGPTTASYNLQYNSCFVRKGMRLFLDLSSSTGNEVHFSPLT